MPVMRSRTLDGCTRPRTVAEEIGRGRRQTLIIRQVDNVHYVNQEVRNQRSLGCRADARTCGSSLHAWSIRLWMSVSFAGGTTQNATAARVVAACWERLGAGR